MFYIGITGNHTWWYGVVFLLFLAEILDNPKVPIYLLEIQSSSTIIAQQFCNWHGYVQCILAGFNKYTSTVLTSSPPMN